MDLLVVWGVAQAAGFVFKPIFEELSKDLLNIGKDAAKDWTKDLFKSIPAIIFNRLQQKQKEEIDIAAGKALKEFLLLVQQELEDAEVEDEQLKQFVKPFKTFIHNKDVKEILGSAFEYECETLNTKKLKEKWDELNLPTLPEEFDWKRLGKRYLREVKKIIRDSDRLRVILDSRNLEAIKDNTQEIAGIIPDFDLLGYQEAIKETYGNLKLESLDTSGYAYNELKLWRMFIAQNVREVHQVLPQHELSEKHLKWFNWLRKSEQAESEMIGEDVEVLKRAYFEKPLHSVLKIVNNKQKYKYTVILGHPGSGKSTLLQFLALNWAESPLNNSISQPIPLLIELRTYMRQRDNHECKNFLEFFHKSPGVVHHLNQLQLHTQLKNGDVLVMFDGLDEVFDIGKRKDVITDIHRFTNEYPDVQVIVTSRVIGYKSQKLRDAQFKHFMLQDLEAEQIQDFIHRWHELTFNNEADKVRKKERLERAIENSKAIRELAGNPLLLTMMAILNRNQELPRDRAELYNQSSRVLLHQWDVERALVEDERLDPKTIDYKDKQAMLRQVAYFMQTSDKGLAGNLIKETDLERILKKYLKTIEVEKAREAAKSIINQLRSRNFMLCYLGADYYGFVHRTFLEYFCAWEFVWKFKETQILSIEQLKTEVFGKHWMDESWNEVLRLIAGMIEPKFVREIIDYLMKIDGEENKFNNIFLAADCLSEVRNRTLTTSVSKPLLNELNKLIKYGIYDKSRFNSYDDPDRKKIRKIRIQAVKTIANTWKDDSQILSILKECVETNESNTVRSTALQELARNFKDEPNTLTWLTKLAQTDEHWGVRITALQELARNWKNEPGIFELFCKCCVDDSFNRKYDYQQNPRQTALAAILNNYPEHPQTLPLLSDRAKNDPDEKLREFAQKQLKKWDKK